MARSLQAKRPFENAISIFADKDSVLQGILLYTLGIITFQLCVHLESQPVHEGDLNPSAGVVLSGIVSVILAITGTQMVFDGMHQDRMVEEGNWMLASVCVSVLAKWFFGFDSLSHIYWYILPPYFLLVADFGLQVLSEGGYLKALNERFAANSGCLREMVSDMASRLSVGGREKQVLQDQISKVTGDVTSLQTTIRKLESESYELKTLVQGMGRKVEVSNDDRQNGTASYYNIPMQNDTTRSYNGTGLTHTPSFRWGTNGN